jgi:hypothetical protein
MIFIATSFWHVLMSRLGFRSISEPLIQALALAALFRGLRLNHGRWIVIAGALVGLNLYTYLAARLFPLEIAAIFLFLIGFDRGQRRWYFAQFIVVIGMALLVFAPLGVYFLNNPSAFLTRIQQVAPHALTQAPALLENIGRALGMFFISGDPYIRFNLPHRLGWVLHQRVDHRARRCGARTDRMAAHRLLQRDRDDVHHVITHGAGSE